VKLLIDEQLSPQLLKWCAERKGLYAGRKADQGAAGGMTEYSEGEKRASH